MGLAGPVEGGRGITLRSVVLAVPQKRECGRQLEAGGLWTGPGAEGAPAAVVFEFDRHPQPSTGGKSFVTPAAAVSEFSRTPRRMGVANVFERACPLQRGCRRQHVALIAVFNGVDQTVISLSVVGTRRKRLSDNRHVLGQDRGTIPLHFSKLGWLCL